MKLKFCKNCKYSGYNAPGHSERIFFPSTVECRRLKGEERINLVDGYTEVVYPTCMDERCMSLSPAERTFADLEKCGEEGKYFKPVKKSS